MSDDAKILLADGVDPQHATDWLRVRREKRRPLTQTAWDLVKAEAGKCGMTPDAAVKRAVEEGWAGFKADWISVANAPPGGSMRGPAPNRQEALEARNRQVAAELAADMRKQQGVRE
jgi:hypothetical protein